MKQKIQADPVAATRCWLRHFVIGHDICPFARREFDADRVRYRCVSGHDTEALLEQLLEECRHLDADSRTATTLLIVTPGLESFEDYLDVLSLAEQLLQLEGYEGIYQLASFHPDYRFGDAPADDPANLTNCSPFPVLHLLREAAIESALERFAHPERIPERNVELLRQRGHDWWREVMAACPEPHRDLPE
ncbi:DUF1415 domain-containing protein [Kushneria phosphatilytica]|uniref:DUF1415 domain-containing protein n=1 Tax=Kushneria phosphatilytica TaxID=657387 RepID=A0A1S1NSE4_9GAMM|nr:DUF1415 domain-containing protein [Kushneria phosphatilytica]OHV12184.1 hypothetical protein BH688_05910 [Kushneria phosphatilytica]QEL11376.1 DUF1415 domain-containing protein [Kushneria phosphatilytica]